MGDVWGILEVFHPTNLVAIAGLRLPLHLVDCQVVQAVLVVVTHLEVMIPVIVLVGPAVMVMVIM